MYYRPIRLVYHNYIDRYGHACIVIVTAIGNVVASIFNIRFSYVKVRIEVTT